MRIRREFSVFIAGYQAGVDMKALVIVAVGILAIGAAYPAHGADLEVPIKAPPVLSYNWSGPYVGANGGWGWGTDSFGYSNNPTAGFFPTSSGTFNRNFSGGFGGVQVGYNYMFTTHWVGGLEFDIDFGSLQGSSNLCTVLAPGGAPAACASGTDQISRFGTGRLRLGYAFDNVLLFATGGGAWNYGIVSSSITCISGACPGASLPFTANTATNNGTSTGWAAGGGIEWGIVPNWTVKAEYLHMQFQSIFYSFNFNGTVAGAPFANIANGSANTGVNVVRVGFNYLLNWPPQVAPWR
jgi:outer membrane immunogenic protein